VVHTYGPCAAGVKKIILEDNQKQYILEVTVILAFFCVLTNQILAAKLPQFRKAKKVRRYINFHRTLTTPIMPSLNFIREYESLVECRVIKDYVCFCFDNEDSFANDIDYCILAELAMLRNISGRIRKVHGFVKLCWCD